MSLGKMPGMKGLVSGSQGKRRFKSDLSVDMISPPMGDFRHTMHVGRGGEVFGDTSFLSNHGGKGGEPGSPDSANSSKTTGFFTRNFRTVRKTPEPRPRRRGSRDLSPPPPPISPIIKNAISLPQLNIDSPNGCSQRALFPSSVSSADDSFYTYGLQSGFVTLPRLSRLDRQFQDGDAPRGSCLDNGDITLTRADSFSSFTVDLGPSLMSEVLSLINDHSCLQMFNHHSQAEGEMEELGDDEERTSITEMVEDSPGMSSPDTAGGSVSLRGSTHNRERSCSSQDEDRASMKTPDASMGSPPVVEPVMEAERFQRAADMLSRHYGCGTFTQGRSQAKDTIAPAFTRSQKTTYTFSEEEEIKV